MSGQPDSRSVGDASILWYCWASSRVKGFDSELIRWKRGVLGITPFTGLFRTDFKPSVRTGLTSNITNLISWGGRPSEHCSISVRGHPSLLEHDRSAMQPGEELHAGKVTRWL